MIETAIISKATHVHRYNTRMPDKEQIKNQACLLVVNYKQKIIRIRLKTCDYRKYGVFFEVIYMHIPQ